MTERTARGMGFDRVPFTTAEGFLAIDVTKNSIANLISVWFYKRHLQIDITKKLEKLYAKNSIQT